MNALALVIIMDIYGWEQDGDQPVFVNVGGNGERRDFGNWLAVQNFISELAGI